MRRILRYTMRASLGLMAIALGLDLSAGWLSRGGQETGGRAQELRAALQERPNDVALLKELGVIYQRRAAANDDARAVVEADRYLARAAALAPSDPEVLAWWGSVEAMKGRDGWFPLLKLVHVWRGMARLDRAVSLAPDNVIARVIRGRTAVRIPRFFRRTGTALEDFAFLLSLPESETAPLLPQIHLYFGAALQRAGETERARAAWRRLIESWPTSPEAREAGLRIAAM
jgi:tetratricopeptide (TPR) repeat protein